MSTYSDRFKKYAAKMKAGASFNATFLKFSAETGNWTTGRDESVIDHNGHRLVADVPDMMHGFQKFEDRVPTYAVRKVDDDVPPPVRKALGDLNKAHWRNGTEDPWQWVSLVPLYDPETYEVFLFVTKTMGGLDATAVLAGAYADNLEAHPEDIAKLPVLALASSSYLNTKGKKIFNPIFDLVTWMERPTGVRRIQPPALPALDDQRSLDLDGADAEIPF